MMSDLSALRESYNKELSLKFSESEIKLIFTTCVSKKLNLSQIDLMLNNPIVIDAVDVDYFQTVISRLQANEPFQYIIGTTEFYNLELLCDSRALIPRPETEELVDWILNSIEENSHVRIMDICSGSGCIALALKSALKSATIDALELSDDAVSLIRDNIDFTGVSVGVRKFDALSEQYALLRNDYSIIVSNPPYIPYEDETLMHANVLEYEPHMALFVEDKSPFIFYEKICKSGFGNLENGGWIYFEIHEDLAINVKSIMTANGFVNIEVRKDLQGKERMIRGQKLTSHHE